MKKGILKHIAILSSIAFAAIFSLVLSFSFFLAETKFTWNEILENNHLGIVIILLQVLAAILLIVFIIYLIILVARSKKAKMQQTEEKVEESADKVEDDYSYVSKIYNENDDVVEEVKPIEEPVEEVMVEEPVEEAVEEVAEPMAEMVEEASEEEEEEEVDEALFEEFDEDSIDDSEFDEEEEEDEEEIPAPKAVSTEDGMIIFEEANKSVGNEVVRRTFLNKMSTQPDEIKQFYSELRNEFLSYRGITSRTTYPCVVFKYENQVIAKFTALSGVLRLHLSQLVIEDYNYNKFFQFSMADKKPYELVPFTTRVKSNRGMSNAKLLIADLMEKLGVERKTTHKEIDFASNFGPQEFSLFKRFGMHDQLLETAAANESEKFISDEEAERIFNESEKVKVINISQYEPKQVSITTALLEEKYRSTQAVTLTSLKRRGLIDRDVTSVKLTAEGQLTKKLDVRLQEITPTAIKMILAVGGNVVKQNLE